MMMMIIIIDVIDDWEDPTQRQSRPFEVETTEDDRSDLVEDTRNVDDR